MSTFSTPLNQLPSLNQSSPQNQNNNLNANEDDMVDDILNEIANENQNNINNEVYNHATDPNMVPPPKMDINFLNEEPMSPNNSESISQNINNRDPIMELSNNNNANSNSNRSKLLSKLNLSNKTEELINNCISKVKSAVIMFAVVFLVSLPQFNRFIFNKIKGMLHESGEINIKGVALKSIIGTLLFLIISLLV